MDQQTDKLVAEETTDRRRMATLGRKSHCFLGGIWALEGGPMNAVERQDTVLDLVEALQRKAPEYLDLITAETDDQFESAFEAILEKAISGLEANSKDFKSLGEDALTGVLALALSMPGLSVTRETHSNGHVDLTITADHCSPLRKKLGEAKIWDGPEYHIKGLRQLLDRYTTGREGRGLVIAYVRKKNIEGLIEKLREIMNRDRPCSQTTDTTDHILQWLFLSTHAHSCGDTLEVGHIGCNLYVESTLDSGIDNG
jgi:hypothetical protein